MFVPLPDAGAIDAVKVMSVPAVGLLVVVLIPTVGCSLDVTKMVVDEVIELPAVSVSVPLTL